MQPTGAPPPHWLGTPPPPQICGAVHAPHWSKPPQPSPCGPHVAPSAAHVVGMHAAAPPHWLNVPPPPHVWGGVHEPHWMIPPHPSPDAPHPIPSCAHVLGTQPVATPLSRANATSPSEPASNAPDDPSGASFVVPLNCDPLVSDPLPAHAGNMTTTSAAPPMTKKIRRMVLTC
jgi:hypothetical protein